MARLSIVYVWEAVEGGELRNGRGRAAWRNGLGFNVAIDEEKGLWHDFVTGDGGNKLSLVCTAMNMTPAEAARWLIALAGIEDTPTTRATRRERRKAEREEESARFFDLGISTLAEHCLEIDPLFNPARPALTQLIADTKRDPAAVYREYLRAQPALAKGLVFAGRRELARREYAAALELIQEFTNAS